MAKELKDIMKDLEELKEHYEKMLSTAIKHCESPANPNDQWYHEKIKKLGYNRISVICNMLNCHNSQTLDTLDI